MGGGLRRLMSYGPAALRRGDIGDAVGDVGALSAMDDGMDDPEALAQLQRQVLDLQRPLQQQLELRQRPRQSLPHRQHLHRQRIDKCLTKKVGQNF